MDKLDDLIKQIEQLRAKQAALTGKPAALFDVNNIEQANAAIQSLEDSIETAQRKVDELEAGFGGIYDQLKAITEEYSKQVTGADRVNKAATGILGISQKLKYDQQGILDLSKKDLENNDKKLRSLRDQITEGANEIAVSKELVKLNDKEFESKLKYYKTTQLISEEEEAILRAQRAGFPVFENLIKQNEKRLELENKIQKSLGLTGDVTKLLGKIPGVGSAASEAFNDVEKEVKEIVKETGKVPDRFQTMGMFADKFGKILIEKITDPLAGMLMAFKAIKDTITAVDKGTVQLQKSLSLSYGEARELRKELSAAALANGNNLVNTQDLLKAQANLNNLLGVQGKINEDNLATQAELTKLLGISEQSAAQLQYFSEATGNDFEQQKLASYEITSEISSQYGVQVNQQKVMEEVGKQGAYALAQFKGSTSELTEAVAKATALGTSLDTVNSIAGSLLNFESSISAELEAELLTGKQINLERARYFALTNDLNGLMDEVNDQMGDFNDFQNMNVIQQQAFAEALGMNVGQLSDMLLMEQYRGQTYEEIAAQQGEDVAKRVENLTLQEKFTESVNKMKDLFVTIAEGPLGMFAELISGILSSTEIMVPLLGVAVGYLTTMAIKGAITTAQFIGRAVASIFTSFGQIPFGVGIPVAIGTVAGLFASVKAAQAMVPKAQFGAEVMGSGNVMVGEVGPEIVNLPAGARVNPLPVRERRDLQTQQSSTQNDNKEMLQALTNMNQRMVEQQRAMSNMRIVLSTGAVEAGLVQNSSRIQ
jgi:hypothetical protein